MQHIDVGKTGMCVYGGGEVYKNSLYFTFIFL